MNKTKNEKILFDKLNRFISKYYKSKIIKGIILLISALFCFLILFALIEYFSRLNPSLRTFLFWSYIVINLFVFITFVFIPYLNLLRIGKSISYLQAAKIIGNHFPEINDKVINLIQLNQLSEKDSGLVEASILQKTNEIEPFSFRGIVQFKENKKYLKWIMWPTIIFLLFLVSGNLNIIKESSARIIDFNTEYNNLTPYPFIFEISNKNLRAIQHKDFLLKLKIIGKKIPNKVYIEIGNNKFSLLKENIDNYKYLFKNVSSSQKFRFVAGKFYSPYYNLECLLQPKIVDFNIDLNFPNYTGIEDESFKNIGDLTVPEGTKINWNFNTKQTNSLEFNFNNNKEILIPKNNNLVVKRTAVSSGLYSILMSNENINNIKINYSITTIKDKYPSILLESTLDSINNVLFFNGVFSDDYSTKKLIFKYSIYSNDSISNYSDEIKINNLSKERFYHMLDLNLLSLSPSDKIDSYFEVWDNDEINGSKSTQSNVITHQEFSLEEIKLLREKETLQIKDNFEEALDLSKTINEEIQELKKLLINKKELSWEEKNKLKSLLNKQKKLEELIAENNKRNNQNNENQKNLNSSEFLEKQKKLEDLMNKVLDEESKNLMDELQKLLDKMDKEKIKKTLDKIDKTNEDLEKELDRNLELYKELEFEQKLNETIENIEDLKNDQSLLKEETDKNNPDSEKLSNEQEKLQEDLENLKKDLEKLKDINSELENKKEIPDINKEKEESSSSMEKSKDHLKKQENKKSSNKQQDAIENLEKISEKMKDLQSSCSNPAPMEDLETLRQILENLIYLSFEEEELINSISSLPKNSSNITKYIQLQKKLADDAKIIEDSLFALSKRVIQIEPIINKEINAINYNMEKAISEFEERKIKSGVSSQQFVMTSANNLSLLLSETLNQMQMDLANSTPGTKQCNKPGSSSKPSLSQLKKMQKDLIKKMKGNAGKGKKKGKKLSEKESENLMKMANQQEQIRMLLQELRDEIGNAGEKGKIDKILEKMEENETDILNNKITNETFMRQQEILNKLLESEESQREQDKEEKRESIEWIYKNENNNSNYLEYIKKQENQKELLKTAPIHLNKFYKDKVNKYFNEISNEE